GGTTEVAVVCHPHPLHGGTMTNKVAHMLAKSFNVVGITAIRFNFRGVGRSAGTYADGIGETDDALAVIEWARQRWPDAAVAVAGGSAAGPARTRTVVAKRAMRSRSSTGRGSVGRPRPCRLQASPSAVLSRFVPHRSVILRG